MWTWLLCVHPEMENFKCLLSQLPCMGQTRSDTLHIKMLTHGFKKRLLHSGWKWAVSLFTPIHTKTIQVYMISKNKQSIANSQWLYSTHQSQKQVGVWPTERVQSGCEGMDGIFIIENFTCKHHIIWAVCQYILIVEAAVSGVHSGGDSNHGQWYTIHNVN